jgi:ElaB/YqjD/DUF883 family membrane-anchored ribosome-binding protein
MPMAKNKPKSTQSQANKATRKAYGKKEIKVNDYLAFGNLSKKDRKNQDKMDKISSIRGSGTSKIEIKDTGKYTKGGDWPSKKLKVTISKVDSDAYKVLKKRATSAGLSGADAKIAIDKALKIVAPRMKSDRSRTATRAKAIAKRESKKRYNTDLTR